MLPKAIVMTKYPLSHLVLCNEKVICRFQKRSWGTLSIISVMTATAEG